MPNSIYNIHNPFGVKYLTRSRIRFSHLKEHKFKHNFQDSIDPMCSCNSGIETTIHFFPFHSFLSHSFLCSLRTFWLKMNIVLLILSYLVNQISKNSFNKAMLNASIEYILSTERFNNPLF